MAASNNSGLGNGNRSSKQQTLEQGNYDAAYDENNSNIKKLYSPSPKHAEGGWGSPNPIESSSDGQRLLETGYQCGKEIYNIMDDGTLVKFMPDNTPENGYHSYKVNGINDIPPTVLKKMYEDGKISKSDYKKYLKNKKR